MASQLPSPSEHAQLEPRQHSPHPGCPDSLSCLPDSDAKPRDTFATIIRCAILGTPSQRMTLNCIYTAIAQKYPYYRDAGPGWKNTVRHVLSTSQQFEKSRRPITEPGKGGYWSVNKQSLARPEHSRSRRSARPARRDPPAQEQPQAVWTPPNAPGVEEFGYMRPLPSADQPGDADPRPPFSGPMGTVPPYGDQQYHGVQPVSQMPSSFQQSGALMYNYEKQERPGWLAEVSWGNSPHAPPMGNVTAANARP